MDEVTVGLTRRLAIATLVGGVLACGAVLAVMQAAQLSRSELARATAIGRTLELSQLLERHVVDLETGLRGYLPTDDPVLLGPWDAALTAIPQEFTQLRSMLAHRPGALARVAALQSAVTAYTTGYARPLITQAPLEGRLLDVAMRTGKSLFDGLRASFATFDSLQQAAVRLANRRAADSAEDFGWTVAVIMGLLLAVVLGLMLYIRRLVVVPVGRLIGACAELSGGTRTPIVPEAGAPELRALAGAFNEMAAELHQRQEALGSLVRDIAGSEERQRLLLGSLPDTMVALFDHELRCVMLDGPVLVEEGLDAEHVGRPLAEVLPPRQARVLAPAVRRALAGETVSLRCPSALPGRTFECDVAPYRLPDGTIEGAFTVARDITERLATEQELRDRERLLAQSQASAHVGSWECELSAGRLRCSEELCRILGQERGFRPTLGELLELVHPDDRDLARERLQAAWLGDDGESHYRIVRADGEVRHVRTSCSRRLDSRGKPTHLFGTTQDVTGQVEREHELRRLAAIVEQSSDAIYSVDAQATITEWNRGAERLYGHGAHEAVGRSVAMLIGPERRGEELALLGRALRGETVEQHETVRRRKDRSRLDVSLTVSPLRNDAGRPVGASIITRDVTAARRLERERRRALAQLADAQRIAGLGSWTWDPESDGASWTEETFRIFGRDPAEGPATGEAFLAYVHPDDRVRLADGYERAFGGGEGFELDFRILAGDGAERVVHALGRREADGRYSGTVQDVTRLREVERALSYSEGFFRSTFEHAPIGIALGSLDGRWLKVNRALCEMLGYEERELLGLTFSELTHPDDLDNHLESSARLLAGELPAYRVEKRYFHKSGRVLRVELSVSLMRDELGQPLHFIVQAQDISAEREAHERLQLILENLDGSAVVMYDRELRLRFCEGPLFPAAEAEPLLGRHFDELAAAGEADPSLRTRLERALDGERSTALLEDDRILAGSFAPYRASDGTIEGALIHWHDVTPLREAQRQRDEARERFQVAFERAPIGMVIVALDGRFLRVNDALCEMTGRPAEELLSMEPFAIVDPEDQPVARRDFAALGDTAGSMASEHRILHAAGHPVWVQARVTLIRDEAGEPVHALAQIIDITEQRNYEAQLRYIADHDSLTGLLNRRGFERVLEGHLAHCRRYRPAGALLVLDLDGFKLVNDTLGHAAGDELIVSCARALASRLRETDVVARLGGDEFAVLLPGEDAQAAEIVAQSLIETIREQAAAIADSHPGTVTVSIGVAPFDATRQTADEMLMDADLAMYEAKEGGKDRYALYSRDGYVEPRIKAQMTWLERIERALAEERFALHAQPILDLRTGEVVQHEVLVRMLDEHGELIPPSSFLYVAERFGVVRDLDRWVVRQAIRAMGQADSDGHPLSLSVNISGLSTGDTGLLETIGDELRFAGVPAERLTVELTETAAVADIPRARRFADALRGIGCRLALDDFGAGFGSFYYLKHLPFDVVKIDGEFVRHSSENASDRLVVKAVAEIARGLGKQTVAEFVPDERPLELLRRHGVDLAQGYHLGRPRPLDDVIAEWIGAAVAVGS